MRLTIIEKSWNGWYLDLQQQQLLYDISGDDYPDFYYVDLIRVKSVAMVLTN